jgi:hypothetical protein
MLAQKAQLFLSKTKNDQVKESSTCYTCKKHVLFVPIVFEQKFGSF